MKGYRELETKATEVCVDKVYAGFNTRLKELIRKRGVNQLSYPVLAEYLGLTVSRCRGVISGISDIPVQDMLNIAKALDVSPDYLVFGVGDDDVTGRMPVTEATEARHSSPSSVYDQLFLDRDRMINLLMDTVLPSLDDEEREAVFTHARLLAERQA